MSSWPSGMGSAPRWTRTHLAACQAMLAVGIVLREVAEALRWSGGRRQMPIETRRLPERHAVTAPLVLAQFSTRLPPECSSACAWQRRSSTCASPISTAAALDAFLRRRGL